MVGTDSQYQFSSAAGGPPVYGFITSRVIMVADEVGMFRELAAGPLLPSELAAHSSCMSERPPAGYAR